MLVIMNDIQLELLWRKQQSDMTLPASDRRTLLKCFFNQYRMV
jgi:hypothetical protein